MDFNKVIAVISGGMDSITMLHQLVKDGNIVSAVSFDYGQRHKKELAMAEQNCNDLGVDWRCVNLSSITELISNSALTGDIDVPEGHYEGDNMKLTVVPNRNSIMANIAIGYAINKAYDHIALAVHAGDHAIYPDCRCDFIDALNNLAQLCHYEPINVLAPYLHKNKIDIVREGLKIGVKYEFTWTCYAGLDKACGKCGSCRERLVAFEKNNILDPLEYA